MDKPRFIHVAGCNAAGKSSFIRSRINQLSDFEIIMTDVYKGRTKEVVADAFSKNKNVILETVFNDDSFKDLVDKAHDKGYLADMICLFLDTPQHSLERVASRSVEQGGLFISGNNIKLNFNESFKNAASYFFYFDRSEFVYTGITGKNKLVMSFLKSELQEYKATYLQYPQKFADYAFQWQRLAEDAYHIIKANQDYNDLKLDYGSGLGY